MAGVLILCLLVSRLCSIPALHWDRETVLATNAVDLVLDQATGDLTAILLASGDNCTVASAFVSADGVWYHLRLAITPAWLNLTVAPDSGSAPLGCQAPVSSPGPSARCRL